MLVLTSASYQHELAYAVQDVEKGQRRAHSTFRIRRGRKSRGSLTSAPGLENERLLELLRSTSKLCGPKACGRHQACRY